MYQRKLNLNVATEETIFLWGPRQTGKSTLLKALYPKSRYYDLLRSDIYNSFITNPGIIREESDALI
jgi:predicted AAA+ superfamily ATPase